MRFISLGKKYDNEYSNFLFNQLGKQKYLYITNTDSDIYIKRNEYEPKYVFFSILNDETIESFKSFIESKEIFMNNRINSDKILLNDYFNIYIDKFETKYNLYIKQYYGTVKLYKSQYEIKDIKNDIDILTKPLNNFT